MNNSPQIFGIIGWPVAHSKSPAMHNAAFQKIQFPGVYTLFAIEPGQLKEAIKAMRTLGIAGVNITLPHKENVIEFLDEVHPDAKKIGAVNTLVNEDGKLMGYNTDAQGFVKSLEAERVNLESKHIVVLGTGGAARAAVVGLAQAKVQKITVVGRSIQKSSELLNSVGLLNTANIPLQTHATDYEQLKTVFSDADLLVQSTSATLISEARQDLKTAQSFVSKLPLAALPSTCVIVDMVYKPLQTQLLEAAENLNLTTVQGLSMLLHQGALAFELWTKQKAPIETMRNVLLNQP